MVQDDVNRLAIEDLMDSLDDLSVDDDLSDTEKCFVFPLLIASYMREVSEDVLQKMIDYVDFDRDDENIVSNIKSAINACHFNNVLRVIQIWEEESIIDPSHPAPFKAMTSPEHAASFEEARKAVMDMRGVNGVI